MNGESIAGGICLAKAIVLTSGGLDSQLAARAIREQGVDVLIVHCASVFGCAGETASGDIPAVACAKSLGVPIRLVDSTPAMMRILKDPHHGYGSQMNPCLDCRIEMLKMAKAMLPEVGADFIVTGEVVGQRPMSQRRFTMDMVAKEAGVDGLVVRPLCGVLLPPTIPEQNGLITREKMFDISGRSRKPQMALAEQWGIVDYPTPAGGCLLTDPGFATRIREAMDHGDVTVNDVRLLKLGRHYRLDPATKAIVGRQHGENLKIKTLALDDDRLLEVADVTGPTTLLRGAASEENLRTAAALTARHSRVSTQALARVNVRRPRTDDTMTIEVEPAQDGEADELLVTAQQQKGVRS